MFSRRPLTLAGNRLFMNFTANFTMSVLQVQAGISPFRLYVHNVCKHNFVSSFINQNFVVLFPSVVAIATFIFQFFGFKPHLLLSLPLIYAVKWRNIVILGFYSKDLKRDIFISRNNLDLSGQQRHLYERRLKIYLY